MEELVILLNNTLKNFQLYSHEHPSFLEAITKLKTKFDDLFMVALLGKDVLEILVKKDTLLLGTEIIGKENKNG